MKRRTIELIGLLTLVVVGGLTARAVLGGEKASAVLEYQDKVNVQFTFEPTLSIDVSGNLSIDDLVPGEAKDSNIITVTTSMNTGYGYTLAATVGQPGGTTNLTGASGSAFQSLASTAATVAAIETQKWGYSYSLDGSSWVSGSQGSTAAGYNGLPLDANSSEGERGKGGVVLLDTDDAADSKAVKFKIGAHASSTQAAGVYTNTVNFYAVAKATPTSFADAFAAAGKTQYNGYYKMQDMTSTICNNVQLTDEASQMQLIDVRDGSVYWVAKLRDGKCWMTENLNLAGGTALYSGTSDVPSGYTSTPYYTLPASATVGADGYTLTDGTQFSSDSGQYSFNSGNVTGTESGCNSTHPCNSYYSWLTATAGGKNSSGASVTGNGYNAAYSICPAGWHLPTATTEGVARDSGGYTGGEFYQMLNLYGLTTGTYYADGNSTPTGASVFANIKAGTVPNFLRAGYYRSGSFVNGGSYGLYWSSTSLTSSVAYGLYFNSSYVFSAGNDTRRCGFSVRCVSGS